MWVAFALQKLLIFLQQNIYVFENTLATTVTEFAINEIVKLRMLWPASVAQLDAPSDWRPGGRQHSFVEIDHEIFSTVILSLPLIQERQLSVSGERMCAILVNRLED